MTPRQKQTENCSVRSDAWTLNQAFVSQLCGGEHGWGEEEVLQVNIPKNPTAQGDTGD